MKTPELLDKINGKVSDNDFDGLITVLVEKIPFVGIYGNIEQVEADIRTLLDENCNLKKLLKSHSHVDGKIVVEI